MGTNGALAVALTGGIASGKSVVCEYFARAGAPVFDADIVARELVMPGQRALKEIVAAFGSKVLTASGTLDRRAMRERIFVDSAARLALEGILHPRIREQLRAQATTCAASYCILAIPLLVENYEHYRWIDRALVIDVPQETQLSRLMRRDGMTAQSARLALDAQATRAQRLALATDVIDNDGELSALPKTVSRLDVLYRRTADEKHV